jgi:hypothetical protein
MVRVSGLRFLVLLYNDVLYLREAEIVKYVFIISHNNDFHTHIQRDITQAQLFGDSLGNKQFDEGTMTKVNHLFVKQKPQLVGQVMTKIEIDVPGKLALFKIATWNVNSVRASQTHVKAYFKTRASRRFSITRKQVH